MIDQSPPRTGAGGIGQAILALPLMRIADMIMLYIFSFWKGLARMIEHI